VPPPFLLEELCHRNAMFVMYHADQMPRVVWHDIKVEQLGSRTFAVTASVRNTRLIPSRAAQAARRKLGLPDVLSIEGNDLEVLAGGRVTDRRIGTVEAADREPAKIRLETGVSTDPVAARWVVRGNGDFVVRFQSQKGGSMSRSVPLRPSAQ
jgi:hypothetical protein